MVVAFALAGCGGDGDDPQPSAGQGLSAEEKQVRAVVLEALTTKDPDACSRLLTQSAVEQFTYYRGRRAVAECREDADEVGAKTVEVRRVHVEGTRAEVDVEPEGGTLTLKTATFVVRKQGGSWKIDALTAGTLDRPAFFREARDELSERPGDLPPDAIECVVNDLEDEPDSAIMRFYVDSDLRLLLASTAACAIRSELPRTPDARPLVDCVTRAIKRELTTGALGRELAREADLDALESSRFQGVVQQLAARCAAQALPGPSGGSVS